MGKVYKYRANTIIDGKKRDTVNLVQNVLYAANRRELNDPFESAVEFPKADAHKHWVSSLKEDLHDVGIYSLSKPRDDETFPCNELLWAHYANSHKGFYIEYDLEALVGMTSRGFDIRNVIHISYQEERPKIAEEDRIDILKLQKKLLGTKSKAWKCENEVRLVFYTSGEKTVSKNAITAIYFG